MDIATIIGFVVAMAAIVGSMIHESGIGPFMDLPAFCIVILGSTGALFINFPIEVMIGSLKTASNAMFVRMPRPKDIIGRIVHYASISRRDGVLALEAAIEQEKDEFLKKGLQLLVDGQDASSIEAILETDIDYMKKRHDKGAEVFGNLANLAPALGLLGTLIGLVAMMSHMEDPSKIGPAMAVALVGTFYGAFVANIIANPIAGKLRTRSAEETLIRNVELQGILQIAAGANPRLVEQHLMSYLSPKLRNSQFEK